MSESVQNTEEITEEVVTELPEVEEEVDCNIQINGKEWTALDCVPVKKIKCIVPEKLLKSIREIEKCVNRKFSCANEFSIYIHGEFDEHGNLVVSEDFYIPKQSVSGASVEYLEEPTDYYNGCLHKHPDGCKTFSGVDEKYINSNFEFSLLYVCKQIHMGIINLNYHNQFRVQIGLNIDIDDGYDEVVNIENIFKKEYKQMKLDKNSPDVETPQLIYPGQTAHQQTLVMPHLGFEALDESEENESVEPFDSLFDGYTL